MLDATRDVVWCFLCTRGRQTGWHESDTGIGVRARMCTRARVCGFGLGEGMGRLSSQEGLQMSLPNFNCYSSALLYCILESFR